MRPITLAAALGLGLWLTPATIVQPRLVKDVYRIGVAGNCCTHGAGICAMFKTRSDTRVVAAFEQHPRRAKELAEVLGKPLTRSERQAILGYGPRGF